jgi:dephospho-CoA kinase
MHFIGITGGVGAGKSFILDYLRSQYGAVVLLTDDLAQELMLPGHELYQKLREHLPASCFLPDGEIDRRAMAEWMYADQARIDMVNSLVHPAVVREILFRRDRLAEEGRKYFFVESALLLGSDLEPCLDECWYIYTSEENRRIRLKASRGYSDEKITAIFRAQLPEEVFRKKCRIVIDNNGTEEESRAEIDRAMKNL